MHWWQSRPVGVDSSSPAFVYRPYAMWPLPNGRRNLGWAGRTSVCWSKEESQCVSSPGLLVVPIALTLRLVVVAFTSSLSFSYTSIRGAACWWWVFGIHKHSLYWLLKAYGVQCSCALYYFSAVSQPLILQAAKHLVRLIELSNTWDLFSLNFFHCCSMVGPGSLTDLQLQVREVLESEWEVSGLHKPSALEKPWEHEDFVLLSIQACPTAAHEREEILDGIGYDSGQIVDVCAAHREPCWIYWRRLWGSTNFPSGCFLQAAECCPFVQEAWGLSLCCFIWRGIEGRKCSW